MWHPCLGWEPRQGGGNHRHSSQAGLSSSLTSHYSPYTHLSPQPGKGQGEGPSFGVRQSVFHLCPGTDQRRGLCTACNFCASPSQLQTLPPPLGLPVRLREWDWQAAGGCCGCATPLLSVAVAPGGPGTFEFRRNLGLTSSGKIYCAHGIHIQPGPPNSV